MIDTAIEKFTALDAVNAGLIDSVNRGETKIKGSFEIFKGNLNFNQKVFCFTDKNGTLRTGKFKDNFRVNKIR